MRIKIAALAFALFGAVTAFGPGLAPADAGGIVITCGAGQCANCQSMTVNGHAGWFCYCGGC
jgi:hypothetical protein